MLGHDEVRRTRRLLLWLYAALSVAFVVGGYLSFANYDTSLRAGVAGQLKSIANLKATDISSWRSERIGDGEMLRSSPGFATLVERAVNGPDQMGARAALEAWFGRIRTSNGYAQVSLIDASGTRVLSSPKASPIVDAALSAEAVTAMRTGKVAIADFHRDAASAGTVHLSVVTPILGADGTGRPIAVVALKTDPSIFLYPYIQQWPGDEKTAETLLVERDGNNCLYLNDLKYQKDAALNLRIPLTQTRVPAVRAALGYEGIVDGVDYRGAPVVAATKLIAGSPWAVVARVDASEVYAPLRSRVVTTISLVVGALLLGLLCLLLVLRMQASRLYREQWEAEAERSWLAAAIDDSLNEVYVFEADTLGLQYLNYGALTNIGFSMAEISGMTPLDIEPEFSEGLFRAMLVPLESGQRRVIIFETIHRRKDGTEYPVVVHLQLTERAGAKVFLAMANDITERRATEIELEAHREHLELLVAERTAQLQEVNEEIAAVNEELMASNEELAAVNEELAATNEELECSNEEMQTLYEEAAESARELERLNTELARSDDAKSDFLASMSHELRTPLNSVIGFSDIMRNGLAGELNEEQQRQMEMINSSGKHLLLLINDVLDLSKVEAGRMDVEMGRFDLAAEVLEVLETVRPQADAGALDLVATGADHPLGIVSDARMVRQILLNLLSNAIKFTERGSVHVGVAERDGNIEIAVADTGPGIALDDQKRIFDAFTQVRVHDHRPDGTGLGLAVSASLAMLLGGTLTVLSKSGEGSTFTLVIPKA